MGGRSSGDAALNTLMIPTPLGERDELTAESPDVCSVTPHSEPHPIGRRPH
jgi:hypothetical protein